MKKNNYLFFGFCILFVTLFLGIGYATVNDVTLTISGLSGSAENGIIKITNVIVKEHTDNVTASEPVWSEDSSNISFSVDFTLEEDDQTITDERSATYEVTLLNDTISEYSFGSDVFRPTLNITPPEGETLDYTYDVIGIKAGDVIPAKTSVTFTVKLNLYPSGGAGNYSGGVSTDVTAEENNQGLLVGIFKNNNNTGDLTGNNTTAPLTITVMNTFNQDKTFTFSVTNNNFSVVDSNNNSNPSFQIPANTESQDFTIYIKRNTNDAFGNSPQRFNLYLNPTDDNQISVGTVEMAVDVDPNFYDNQPPNISSITATKVSNKKSVSVSWAATDNYGIDHYNVYAYNSSGTEVGSATNITDTTYTFDNLSNGSYYFKVVAYDGKGNNSEKSTDSTAYSWTYTARVTTCTNCTANPTTQNVEAGQSFSVTLTGRNGHTDNRPQLVSVVMTDSVTQQQTTLTENDYTYNTSNGVLTISNVTGNVTITAEGIQNGACLVKGTKILLANGKTKNIEDIDYNDLLAVWNYNDGSITYEYPIWIEKEKKTNTYIKISFSDKTYLKIYGNHSLYSMDHNKFINLDDKEFKVGTNIAKLNNNKLEKVKITNIETINENTTYYFVGSTAYYNIIADNVLTTDVNTMISNLYGFNDNAIWPKEKDLLVQNNTLEYKYFEDVLPYYLFKGFRVKEAGFLINNNFITLNDFKKYITTLVMNETYLKNPVTNINGKRTWMVTTSLDNVNDFNKKDFLFEEGSTYILPKSNKVKMYYSTSENIYYKPGDKVTVWHGMHFIAIY